MDRPEKYSASVGSTPIVLGIAPRGNIHTIASLNSGRGNASIGSNLIHPQDNLDYWCYFDRPDFLLPPVTNHSGNTFDMSALSAAASTSATSRDI
ncbi:hypothetical protein CF319_g1832 [Tilletia indica]|nr:hypothetical protein CF319_g1832 [Tilletia indica]